MELRQLEAFVAVATELHFGRAAQNLHMSQSTLSELIQRLEREMGTPLLLRTTRRVALSSAGAELLGRAKVILDDVVSATAAVQRLADGDTGTVRIGITPPVAPVLSPHLAESLRAVAPEIELVVTRMWLTDLTRAIAEGTVDVAITCGVTADPPGVVGEVFCGEPLLVSLRSDHPLAGNAAVSLAQLENETLGVPREALFPAWASAQRQALEAAGVAPPTVEIAETNLSACHWYTQEDIVWIVTTPSIAGDELRTPLLPITPTVVIPYTLQWNPDRATTAAVGRFVQLALTAAVPAGWVPERDHLHYKRLTTADTDHPRVGPGSRGEPQ
jgi:DNA-binding transcriptional LysR family regulator